MPHPLRYEIDSVGRYARIIYSRQPEFPEWLHTIEAVLADPRLARGFGILMDRRYVMRPASEEYIRAMVAYIDGSGSRNGERRWAILVTDDGSFAMAKLAEQLSTGTRIKAFREVEKATKWAGGEG